MTVIAKKNNAKWVENFDVGKWILGQHLVNIWKFGQHVKISLRYFKLCTCDSDQNAKLDLIEHKNALANNPFEKYGTF